MFHSVPTIHFQDFSGAYFAVSFKEATIPSTGEFFRSPQWLLAIQLEHHLHPPRFPHETFQEIPAGPTSPEDPEDQLKSSHGFVFKKKGLRENPWPHPCFFLGGYIICLHMKTYENPAFM